MPQPPTPYDFGAGLRGGIPLPPKLNLGTREDGTAKGRGWLGILKRPGGGYSSELSASVNMDGKEVLFPLLVPGLAPEEVQHLLTLGDGSKIPHTIMQKAIGHAVMQMRQGMSPFKSDPYSIPAPVVAPKGGAPVSSVPFKRSAIQPMGYGGIRG